MDSHEDTDPAGAGSVSHTANDLNEYTDIDSSLSPVYDANGNMEEGPLPVDPSQEHSLEWDGENRLIRVSVTGGSSVTYTYDAFGRRTVSLTGSTRTYTLWDDWSEQSEYTGANHVTGTPPSITHQHTWLWGLDLSETLEGAGGVGGLLADEIHTGSNAGVYHPLYDGNGNVTEYLTSSGVIATHFEYDPYGNLVVAAYESTSTPDLTGISDELRFKFSTKYEEPASGLYYYGYRYYDPVTGRWPSRDPIEEAGGVNLYGLGHNSPPNGIDALGREWVEVSLEAKGRSHKMTVSSAECVCYIEVEQCCLRRQYKMNHQEIAAQETLVSTRKWSAERLRKLASKASSDATWCGYTAVFLKGVDPRAARMLTALCAAYAYHSSELYDEADRQEREICHG